MSDLNCYKVELETTNGVGDTTCNDETDTYRDVIDGIAYVITDDPKTIYDTFGKEAVIKIEKVGIGYILMSVKKQK